MKKRYLLGGLALLLAAASFAGKQVINQEKDKARISEIVDGDTLVMEDNSHIRLANINSPERDSPLYKSSLEYLKKFKDKSVRCEIIKEDQYRRKVARIYDGTNYLNLALVRQGCASKFMVQEGEEKAFAKAEEDAIADEKGIWKKSKYFGRLKITLDPRGESVTIESRLNEKGKPEAISLEGCTIKDESRAIYILPKVNAKKTTILSSKIAKKALISGRKLNDEEIIWTSKDIWNDDQDTFYLFDRTGRIIAYYCYGYQ
jgi:endonuclease YncB( thermonuclease family)